MPHRNLDQLGIGLDVRSADAQTIGTVKELHAAGFVIDRPLQPDVTVPYDAIRSITDEGVVLTLTAMEVDDRFWAHAGEGLQVDLRGQYD